MINVKPAQPKVRGSKAETAGDATSASKVALPFIKVGVRVKL